MYALVLTGTARTKWGFHCDLQHILYHHRYLCLSCDVGAGWLNKDYPSFALRNATILSNIPRPASFTPYSGVSLVLGLGKWPCEFPILRDRFSLDSSQVTSPISPFAELAWYCDSQRTSHLTYSLGSRWISLYHRFMPRDSLTKRIC